MTTNNQNANITRTLSSASPLNTYHNSLRKMRNDDKCFCRSNSLKRSFKKINNDSPCNHHQITPHHCTIELKTKATSCLHLFHKNAPPVILTTFKNQQQINSNDRQKTNEFLWRYHLSQCDLSKKLKASSHLNILHHNYHHQHQHQHQHQTQHEMHAHAHNAISANINNNVNNTTIITNNNNANPMIMDTKFNNPLENQSTL